MRGLLFTILILLVMCAGTWQRNLFIKVVKDTSNDHRDNVSIRFRSKGKGLTTNQHGECATNLPENTFMGVFSYIGYRWPI